MDCLLFGASPHPPGPDRSACFSAVTTAEQTGTVYLVGAGPGDPELLTLKAHRLLSQCDALVYDSLVPEEVLDLVPATCERRFVGKRRGHHSVPQPSTNAVLVEMAQKHSTVVRLKGVIPSCLVVEGKKPLTWRSGTFLFRWCLVSPLHCRPCLRRNSRHPPAGGVIGDLRHRS